MLDAAQLRALVEGFRKSALFPIVATAARTGAWRNEMLALRVDDLDPIARTLKIERAIEETKQRGLKIKGPKQSAAILGAQCDKLRRIMAGVGDDARIDLSLVKLPDDALLFLNPPRLGADFSFTTPRKPRSVTKEFTRKAKALGFSRLRFHDLRG